MVLLFNGLAFFPVERKKPPIHLRFEMTREIQHLFLGPWWQKDLISRTKYMKESREVKQNCRGTETLASAFV